MGWGFELRALHLIASTLPLGPKLHSILLWLFLQMGSQELLAQASFKPQSPDLSFHVARIIGISHQCLAKSFNLDSENQEEQ
jgi:hypothetical protein